MDKDIAVWIREVRGEMTQAQFAKCVYHYEMSKSGQRECIPYHRNQIVNWEKGRNKNFNTESFLSIALLDYDKQHPEVCKTQEERNQRFFYASEIMKKMLGINLYCRNLHDALLIQVCRNILSFEELLSVEEKYEERLKKLKEPKEAEYLSHEEKSKISLQRETENIKVKLYRINTRKELDELFEENKKFFYTANRVLGERLLKIYNSSDRYPQKLELQEAVQIYAPNYRDSYIRMFSSSGITREWLLDFCEHLRFSKDEKEQILENAHMQPLTEESAGRSALAENMKWPLEEKLEVMLLFSLYIKTGEMEELPPVEYLIESFSLYNQGKGALKELKKILGGTDPDPDSWVCEDMEKELLDCPAVCNWTGYIKSGYFNAENQRMRLLLQQYRQEHQEYFELSPSLMENIKKEKMKVTRQRNMEEAVKLHYLAALFYTVLTGKYYTGKITGEDAKNIKSQFKDSGTEINYMYNFLTFVFGIFLGEEPLIAVTDINEKTRNVKFCIYDKNRGKNTRGIDMEEICDNLWLELLDRAERKIHNM